MLENASADGEILKAQGISMRFGSLWALKDVSLSVRRGEIHAVVGENGAGKSTLMKCLYGLYHPTAGSVAVNGKMVSISSPAEAMALGIGMVHQHFMLIPSFSVVDNVVLGAETRHGLVYDRCRAVEQVRALSQRWGLNLDPDERVGDLPVGLQQRVEILKVLYRSAGILIFDEPTAVLTPQEVESFFEILRTFRKAGRTVLFVAHDLREVLTISDRVTVLRGGHYITTKEAGELTADRLTELMVGHPLQALTPRTAYAETKTILETRDLTFSRGNRVCLDNCSLSVKSGEILGIAGITGNGQSELEEILCGYCRPNTGSVLFNGLDVTKMSVSERRSMGMAWIPEDRLRTGLAGTASLPDNAVMGWQRNDEFQNYSILIGRKVRLFTSSLMKRWGVTAAEIDEQAGTLSGGNMQRLVMGREVEHHPRLLVVAQPTRGVDIGGTQYIRSQLLELRNAGAAIVLISTNLDEVLELSDRVAVIHRGRIAAVLPRAGADRTLVGRLMLQGGNKK